MVDPAGPSAGRDLRRVLAGATGMPVLGGNEVSVLHDADILPAMLDAVRGAQRTIDLMSYVWWDGKIAEEFAEALAERAETGLRVRVLLDGIGARRIEDRLERRMREASVQLEFVRPGSWKLWQLNQRTHRRVLVCDEQVAFTGGVGIAQEWAGSADQPAWRDTQLRVRGPAVDGIHAGFHRDWIETPWATIDGVDRFPVRERVGDTPVQVLVAASQPGWNEVALALHTMIEAARSHLRVTTAYLRPPGHFRRLLCAAARRGVEVDLLVPGPHAQPVSSLAAGQYHYTELLEAGIRIWEYQPTMMHAKVMTVDGQVGLVGTPNFDARSLTLNEQIAVILHDPSVTAVLDRQFAADVEASDRVDPHRWHARGRLQRAREWAAHAGTFPIRGAAATKRGRIVGEPRDPTAIDQ